MVRLGNQKEMLFSVLSSACLLSPKKREFKSIYLSLMLPLPLLLFLAVAVVYTFMHGRGMWEEVCVGGGGRRSRDVLEDGMKVHNNTIPLPICRRRQQVPLSLVIVYCQLAVGVLIKQVEHLLEPAVGTVLNARDLSERRRRRKKAFCKEEEGDFSTVRGRSHLVLDAVLPPAYQFIYPAVLQQSSSHLEENVGKRDIVVT